MDNRTVGALLALGIVISTGVAPARAGGVWKPTGDGRLGGTVAPNLRGKPLIVRIHADWCAECQTTLPDFVAFAGSFKNRINVIDIDVTDGKTSTIAAALAQRSGLRAYYEKRKAQPLTVAFIDPDANVVVAELRGNVDRDDLLAAKRAVDKRLRHR